VSLTPDRPDLIGDELSHALGQAADAADRSLQWPAQSWDRLCPGGILEWSVPSNYGGRELNTRSLLEGYERLASACLTTAFILSQRDAAVRRIRDSGRDDLCRELLRPLACGGRFATVGISQLTTSRQHGGPALRAREFAAEIVLDGVMPWVTAADRADHIVAGAVLDDGRQVLLAVPTETPGLSVGPPHDLMALAGSRTAEVRCDGVAVSRHWLLAGPAERVMQGGRGGTGGLETSCLALGLAGAAIDFLADEARGRPDLEPLAGRLETARTAVRAEMHRTAEHGGTPEQTTALRARANALVLRATQAALTAAKGVGFVHPHPAQRWARQALFFLVWSCPRPAAEATLGHLLGECEGP
jgi:alkylation response protein AidB-like acyl-CoA dehydrogenase